MGPESTRPVIVLGRFPPPRDGQSLATERLAEMLGSRFDVRTFNTEPPDRGYVAAETRFRADRVAHFARLRGQLSRAMRDMPGAPVFWASISPTLLGHLRDMLTIVPAFGRNRTVIAISHASTLHERFSDPRTRATMTRLAERVDAFVFLTESIADTVSEWIPAPKRHVIPNTIAEELRGEATEIAAKQDAREKEPTLELLFLSNMIVEKGWLDVLRALPLARRLGVSFRARFAGRWVRRDDEILFKSTVVDNELEDVVEYLGGLEEPESIHRLYLSSDVLLLPTYYPVEAMPLVVLEGFAAGVPVIGTHHGGLAALIDDGVNGARVPPRDPVAIANAIARLAVRSRWRRLSEGARRTFVERFDRNAVLEQWVRLLEGGRDGARPEALRTDSRDL